MATVFPVDQAINPLLQALKAHGRAILEAPPGAGKSTRVPLALLDSDWGQGGKILMLEPRRVAARSVATFMAMQLGQPVGQSVGYRTRTDTRVSAQTRLEVVTEGVLTRMLLNDPELPGVSLVIFDEFHERSLHADLGLALVLEASEAFRPDLGLLVMSATLDCGPLEALLQAPVVRSQGQSYPVTISHAPVPARQDWRDHCAEQVMGLLGHAGVILVFLPGQGDMRRVASQLDRRGCRVPVATLHGGLSLDKQQRVLELAASEPQLIVLTTNVAETSLTIDGVTHVVDSGFAREPVYDPARHRTRLVTRRISDANARQRSGRAGRLGPGHSLRLWGEADVLARYQLPEIQRVGLDRLVLDLARWGCREPQQMPWLDAPPQAAWDSAVERLQRGGALDQSGSLTSRGEAIARLPVDPSLALLLIAAKEAGLAEPAARLVAVLSERDILAGEGVDLRRRLEALENHPQRFATVLAEAKRLNAAGSEHAPQTWRDAMGGLLASVFALQISRRRSGSQGRYQMADGPGLFLHDNDSLQGTEWLLVMDTDGQPKDARIRLAWPLTDQEIESVLEQHGRWREHIGWDTEKQRVSGRRERVLGNLVLQSQPLASPSNEQQIAGLLAGIRSLGLAVLPWEESWRQWQARILRLSAMQPEAGWPDVSDAGLLSGLEQWLGPYLAGMRSVADLKKLPLGAALSGLLSIDQQRQLKQWMPETVTIPTGRTVRLDYTGGHVVLAAKLQELFGLQTLPTLADGALAITVHLLTPAGRPAAITDNLARFWAENYAAVRKDLRGRYPKHPWPEDPLQAQATGLTKRRLGQ
ncbi:ATP-dependent helicase HrpB [Alcanivorax sp.]|uniref:ATP-dependent helicase HrpB n=1 Tax=Alcanivorax sp. TaxID=1872427 RepID=UPI002B2797F6|nr:ATP-dependent helicase HrpB [Alcanivorax sp.]